MFSNSNEKHNKQTYLLCALSVVQLDVTGFNVMKKFIYAVETRGAELIYSLLFINTKYLNTSIYFYCKFQIFENVSSLSFFSAGIDEQGLYRIAGVNSRVQKLLSLAMGTHNTFQSLKIKMELMVLLVLTLWRFPSLDPKTCADVELENHEWEIKTITSAIKHYLRWVQKENKNVPTSRPCVKTPQRINCFFSSHDYPRSLPFISHSRSSGVAKTSPVRSNSL